MKRSWAWLSLCLGLTSTALAESSVPMPRVELPREIPSGGVLPMLGRCYDEGCSALQSAVVTDAATGARVEGVLEVVPQGRYYDAYAYFVPSVPFVSGTMLRVTLASYAPASATVSVGDAASGALDESSLSAMSWLGKERVTTKTDCCLGSAWNCLDVEGSTGANLLVTLYAEEPIVTQYVFELTARAEQGTSDVTLASFRPLPTNQPGVTFLHTFDGAAKGYCFTLRARPIQGGEPVELTSRCMANDFTGFGKDVRSPDEIARWKAAMCKTTPPDAGVQSKPRADAAVVDAAVDGDGEELGRGDDRKGDGEESGCRLAAGDSSGLAGWLLALATVVIGRRRRAA